MKTILVTGSSGLVGNAIKSIQNEFTSLYSFIFSSSKECDLLDYDSTNSHFQKYKPDYVIHLAANVGGLFKNMNNKVDMLEKNLLMNFNVVKCCYENKVEKLICMLSTCIFPDKVEYPIVENPLIENPIVEDQVIDKRKVENPAEIFKNENDQLCLVKLSDIFFRLRIHYKATYTYYD